jgi:cobalt-zinc-cadmium efflux system outer membrane protein
MVHGSRRRLRVALTLISVSALANAAPAGETPTRAVALGADYPVVTAPHDPANPAPAPANLIGSISLRDAIAAALLGSPELAAVAYELRSREARELQAAARPNPELGVELENVAGSGARSGVDAAETTLSLAQLVELGGKRESRVRLASRERELASWDFETLRLAVITDVTKAFVTVLAQQERQALVRELEALAAETLRSVASTVRAGAVSAVEEERARVNLDRVQLELARNAKALEAARALLAATWGEPRAQFERARGELAATPPVPALAQLEARVAENPELARWNSEIAQREAALALERSRRVPDPTLSLGARHFADGNDAGLVASVSVPLPLFNRNRGSVLDARYGVARARVEQRLAEVSARTALASTYQNLLTASGEALALRDRIIPRAERVFRETQRGYATGLFRYVEVLDAQRTLFAARSERIDVLVAYHFAATDLERLTASPLASLAGGTQP